MDETYWNVLLGFMIINTSFLFMLQQGIDPHAYCQIHLPQTNQTGTSEFYYCTIQSLVIPVIGLFIGAFIIVIKPIQRKK